MPQKGGGGSGEGAGGEGHRVTWLWANVTR